MRTNRDWLKMNSSDLSAFCKEISAERDLAKKKAMAIEMSNAFTAGGKEKFVDSINKAQTTQIVDQICWNAMLKGEGMSTKLF